LRTKAAPVVVFDEALQQLVADMTATMYEASGIGLAATQVNVHQQIVVIDVSDNGSMPQVFINPAIKVLDEVLHEYEEGCLSVPGFHETVERPEHIEITAQDSNGETFTLKPDGLLAVCIQHEVDHLNGKLFVDYISSMKRTRIRKKLEKQHRQKA